MDSKVVGVTNSGEDDSYCRGRSVGHGVGYSGGEDSYCKVQSVVCSGLRCI